MKYQHNYYNISNSKIKIADYSINDISIFCNLFQVVHILSVMQRKGITCYFSILDVVYCLLLLLLLFVTVI